MSSSRVTIRAVLCLYLCFRGAFMFLKPSLSSVSVIYKLPFSTSVWITYTVSVAILTAVLMLTRRLYQRVNPCSSSDYSVGWGDSIMDSLAIVCQQGDYVLIFLLLRIQGLQIFTLYMWDNWHLACNFTSHLLYLQGMSSHYPLDSRLGGPHSQCDCCGENFLICARN